MPVWAGRWIDVQCAAHLFGRRAGHPAKLFNRSTDLSPQIRELARPEDDQGDDEYQDQLARPNVEGHDLLLFPCAGTHGSVPAIVGVVAASHYTTGEMQARHKEGMGRRTGPSPMRPF